MTAPNLFPQLRTLGSSSLKSPSQIAGTPCEKQFRECVPNLHDDEVTQLVGHLDNVRLLLVFPDSGLIITILGSTYPGSCKSYFPEVPTSARMDVRHSRNATEILQNPSYPPSERG